MKHEEVRKLGGLLEPYVRYEEFNLWDICFAGIYNVFLKNPSRKNIVRQNLVQTAESCAQEP